MPVMSVCGECRYAGNVGMPGNYAGNVGMPGRLAAGGALGCGGCDKLDEYGRELECGRFFGLSA